MTISKPIKITIRVSIKSVSFCRTRTIILVEREDYERPIRTDAERSKNERGREEIDKQRE